MNNPVSLCAKHSVRYKNPMGIEFRDSASLCWERSAKASIVTLEDCSHFACSKRTIELKFQQNYAAQARLLKSKQILFVLSRRIDIW